MAKRNALFQAQLLSLWSLPMAYPVRVIHGELLLLDSLELVPDVELCRFLLELGELVLVLRNLLQRGLDAKKRICN